MANGRRQSRRRPSSSSTVHAVSLPSAARPIIATYGHQNLSLRLCIYIYIYICISVHHTVPASGGKPRVKMASRAFTWMSSKLWRRKRQRSGQIYYIILSSKAYYSSQSLCSHSVSRDTRAGDGWHNRASSIVPLSALP